MFDNGLDSKTLDAYRKREIGAYRRLRDPEFTPMLKLMEHEYKKLIDTLKKSDNISVIRFAQGQVAVLDSIFNKINS